MVEGRVKVREDAVYASFIGPFLGYYARVPDAENDIEARWMLNQDRRTKRLWCSVYTYEQVQEQIKQFGGQIIEIKQLDYAAYQLHLLRQEIEHG